MIMRLFQLEPRIGLERPIVVLFNIKPDAGNIPLLLRLGQNKVKQSQEDAAPPKVRPDEDALQPPKIAIAPIAPFVGNHQLPHDLRARLGHKISAFGGVAQNRVHARLNRRGLQNEILGLPGQFDIKPRQDVHVSRNSFSDSSNEFQLPNASLG